MADIRYELILQAIQFFLARDIARDGDEAADLSLGDAERRDDQRRIIERSVFTPVDNFAMPDLTAQKDTPRRIEAMSFCEPRS